MVVAIYLFNPLVQKIQYLVLSSHLLSVILLGSDIQHGVMEDRVIALYFWMGELVVPTKRLCDRGSMEGTAG